MTTPRAYTSEELREKFLNYLHTLVDYWAELPDQTPKQRLSGLMFSTLVTFDGGACALPGFDLFVKAHPDMPRFELCVSPHPDDKEYCQKNSENWYEDGMSLYDDLCPQLHEQWHRKGHED